MGRDGRRDGCSEANHGGLLESRAAGRSFASLAAARSQTPHRPRAAVFCFGGDLPRGQRRTRRRRRAWRSRVGDVVHERHRVLSTAASRQPEHPDDQSKQQSSSLTAQAVRLHLRLHCIAAGMHAGHCGRASSVPLRSRQRPSRPGPATVELCAAMRLLRELREHQCNARRRRTAAVEPPDSPSCPRGVSRSFVVRAAKALRLRHPSRRGCQAVASSPSAAAIAIGQIPDPACMLPSEAPLPSKVYTPSMMIISG